MQRYALPVIIVVGFILRIGYAVAIYEPTLLHYFSDDYVLYRMGAEAIMHGDLSFSQDTFLLRPPLFPLMVAALGKQPVLILSANIVISTIIISITYIIGLQLNLSQ